MVKHLSSSNIGFLAVLLALVQTGSLTLGISWQSCTTSSCQSALSNYTCAVNAQSECQCDVSQANQSTCGMLAGALAQQTGLNLNTNQGPLRCCLCRKRNETCCQTCPSPVIEDAILLAVFILDCNKYTTRTNQLGLWFRYALGNLTNTDNTLTDVTKVTCVTGVQPYCGFDGKGLSTTQPSIYSNVDPVHCNALVINATIREDTSSATPFKKTIDVIKGSTQNGTFVVPLWDGARITVSFLLSKVGNSSYVFQHGRYEFKPSVKPAKKVPPIHTNLWPLIYTGIAVGSLIALCIVWQCLKQTYLLRKKKYTDINSNRVSSHKRKVQEAMENKGVAEKAKEEEGQFNMTHHEIQTVDNEALTRRYDWTTPGYLPSMMAPGYAPTDLHGQQAPPRLMLDDEDSDSDKKSIGKASVINIDEESDEDLKEILESDDDEDTFRTNTRQSHVSTKISIPNSNKRKASTTSKGNRGKRNSSAQSTLKSQVPAIGQVRKCSYSGPKERERTPSLGFGNLKNNRITPTQSYDERKLSVTSLKKAGNVKESSEF